MHMRVIEAHLQTDKFDEAASMYKAAMEAARQTSGFIRGQLVVDRSSGKTFSQ